MKKWFPIFRTGEHTDASGKTRKWTEEDLDKIVSSYDPKKHEAPIVVGHPKDNTPAFGWIRSLKRVGDTLMALPGQLVPEFVEAVKNGIYKKRSIALYPDLSLKHVGFLGGAAPAVKGLADVDFAAEEESACIEFGENLPAGFDDEEEPVEELVPEPAFKEKAKEEPKKAAEETNFEMKFTESERRRVAAENELEKLRLRSRKTEFETFLNERIAYGNITPAMKPVIEKLLEAVSSIQLSQDALNNSVFEFADGSKENPVELLKKFIKELPKVVEFAELAKKESREEKPVILDNQELAAEILRQQTVQK